MIYAGCDIGSLTAKAVLIEDDRIISSKMMRVKATALKSAHAVMSETLETVALGFDNLDYCCTTGYGRFDVPFSDKNISEISCHGLGAFWSEKSIGTVIDIGGQDCKVVVVDGDGMVEDFIMNEKCAAGTGRSLEILSKSIGINLEELGPVSLQSEKSITIANKCSIFMEMEVMQHLYNDEKISDIAYSINMAVAKRVVQLAKAVKIKDAICITGGVSKNVGVVTILEDLLELKFKTLPGDPQLMGAIGAAVFAKQNFKSKEIINR